LGIEAERILHMGERCMSQHTQVRAKMTVNEVVVTTYSESVKLSPVCGGSTSKEDNSYAAATPGGKLELTVDNAAVKGFFKPGRKYYIDISECPEEAQK
jgi:hypothetical protein